MLPRMKQRMWIALTIGVGGLVLLLPAGLLAPGDGSGGLVLFQAQVGPIAAVGLVVLAALPAVVLGVVTAAAGNALGGLFAVAGALALPAIAGGPSQGWLWRTSLPGGYGWLAAELLLWSVGLIGVMALIEAMQSRLRDRLAERREAADAPEPGDAAGRWAMIERFFAGLLEGQFISTSSTLTPTPNETGPYQTLFRLPGQQGLIGGAIAAGVGGILANLMLRSTDMGQVTGALILAFTLGALVARAIVPGGSAAAIALSPCLAGLLGYAYLAVSYLSNDQVLAAWYGGELLSLGLALPIHYASAGVVGATMGLGLGQGIERMHHEEVARTS